MEAYTDRTLHWINFRKNTIFSFSQSIYVWPWPSLYKWSQSQINKNKNKSNQKQNKQNLLIKWWWSSSWPPLSSNRLDATRPFLCISLSLVLRFFHGSFFMIIINVYYHFLNEMKRYHHLNFSFSTHMVVMGPHCKSNHIGIILNIILFIFIFPNDSWSDLNVIRINSNKLKWMVFSNPQIPNVDCNSSSDFFHSLFTMDPHSYNQISNQNKNFKICFPTPSSYLDWIVW